MPQGLFSYNENCENIFTLRNGIMLILELTVVINDEVVVAFVSDSDPSPEREGQSSCLKKSSV